MGREVPARDPRALPRTALISPSRSALTVTRVLLPEINGHCASAGVIESPACGAGSGEGSAFLVPPPSLSGRPGAKFTLAPGAAACGEPETSPCTCEHRDPARLRVTLHLRSPVSTAGRSRGAGLTKHWGKIHPLKIVAASAIAAQAGLRTDVHITRFGVPSFCPSSCQGDVHPKANPQRPPIDGTAAGGSVALTVTHRCPAFVPQAPRAAHRNQELQGPCPEVG